MVGYLIIHGVWMNFKNGTQYACYQQYLCQARPKKLSAFFQLLVFFGCSMFVHQSKTFLPCAAHTCSFEHPGGQYFT